MRSRTYSNMKTEKTILVVDDEQGFRDMYVYFLEPLGFKVTCVCNGYEAVEKVRQADYDLIFMDIHMPVMTGPEALKEIKKIRPKQKVVIFSSSSDPDHKMENEALKLGGALQCLFKPVDLSHIEGVLAEILGPIFPAL